jgi:methylphosphotriester-DNA--protein-cysteine methyltransferase
LHLLWPIHLLKVIAIVGLAELAQMTNIEYFLPNASPGRPVFTASTGQSPAHFIERVRLDAARTLLAQRLPIKTIATKVGLSPTARFTAAFTRQFGVSPRLFRETHAMPSKAPHEGHLARH